MLAATVGVYDENVIAPNTVDFVAPGSNVTNTQLAADVASAFSQNRSGVIDGSVLGGQYEFGVSQSKTLSVSNTMGIGSPSGGREISGTGAFATGSPSYNSTSFSFNSITNGQPNEHVIEFGVTALSLTNRNYGNVTTTGYLASGGTVSATRPISEANGAGDTFFGFRAPANDYFSRFTIGYSGAESSPDFRLWIDDIGFVTGVVGPNTAPVAMNDSYTINEDSFLDIQTPGVLNNDTDADGNSLTAIKLTNPTNGVAVLQPNGALRYFPNFNFSGTDTFTYKVNDGSSDSNVAVVTITVNPVNDAPFVDSPTVTTDEDTPYSGLIDSIDVEGDSYSFSLASDPSHGTAIVNTDGTFTYSPSLDYFGSDSFVFRATDTRNATRLGTVTVNIVPVNDAPIARDDNYSVEESGTLTLSSLAVSRLTMASEPGDWVGQGQSYDYFAPSANFTANKNFDNGVSLAVTQSFLAHQESWNLNFAAPFDALLAPGLFTGATRFPFQSSSQPGLDVSGIGRGHNMLDGEFVVYDVGYGPNNSVTRFAGSFIQREHSNTSPAPSLTGAVRFNSSIGTGGGVTANDLDIEGDLFTTVLASGPSNGSLTLNKDGTLVYTPNTGFSGEDTFTYRANDGRSLSNLATATITVNAINDDPVAEDDSYEVDEDNAVTILAAGVLDNDSDFDGDSLTAAVQTGPSNGTLALNADGSFTYTPNANFNGSDSFTYVANDGTVNSNVATVNLTIKTINDGPVAVDDAYEVDEDGTLTVVASTGALDNDSDFDSDSLSAVVQSGPSNGTLTLNADGSFAYTPNANFNGSDSFSYTTSDGNGGADSAFVSISVNPINDAPVAVNDAFAVQAAGTRLNVLQNDIDADGDSLAAIIVSQPSNGTLDANADGSFLFTPNDGFNGVDLFTYVATDGESESDVATVEVTVNSGPLAVEYELKSRRINLQSNGKITITVLGNANLDGSVLNASSIRFVGVSAESWSTEDVDNDGDTDLVLKFDARELREHLLDLYFASESNERERTVSSVLTGATVHDQAIEGLGMLDLFLPNEPGKKSGK